jgi:hypothetical protein
MLSIKKYMRTLYKHFGRLALIKVLVLGIIFWTYSCNSEDKGINEMEEIQEEVIEEEDPIVVEDNNTFSLPEIALDNWKVTLPISRNGRPIEVEPPEILDYATNEVLKPFMYNDSIEGALVFYTYPGATTANSSYSRTELREQMVPGSNSTNWTFDQGGRLKGTLALDTISRDGDGDLHRTMVMQIHGRLTNEQRDRIGEDDNNAPPMVKIYWQNGYVRVVTKALKDTAVNDFDILFTDAWEDGESHIFPEKVDYEKFTLEIIASTGKIEVTLNENDTKTFEGIHMEKWGVFENYFKAGNYLQTTDSEAFARVRYYSLLIDH